MSNWLSLTEYSNKYNVSISTLRRRIKSEDIKYVLDDGKYFISDEPTQKNHRPSLAKFSEAPQQRPVQTPPGYKPVTLTSAEELKAYIESTEALNAAPAAPVKPAAEGEPVITAANRLLSELKRAYTQILQEKEEQILHLKEEVSDLKTLVRVLESENERLQR